MYTSVQVNTCSHLFFTQGQSCLVWVWEASLPDERGHRSSDFANLLTNWHASEASSTS